MGGDTDEMSVESDRVRGEKRRREPSTPLPSSM